MKKKIINILINPFIISLVISLIIIILLPPIFDKYKIEEIDHSINISQIYFYEDLDNDNFSEEVRFLLGKENSIGVIVSTKGKVIDQWKFPGTIAGGSFYIIGDYDRNGLKEIYLFTYQDDSIFMHGLDPFNSEARPPFKKYISRYQSIERDVDLNISPGGINDLNGDGFGEVIFSIVTGFILQPRGLFAYDIKNDTVYKSPEIGINIKNPVLFDIDNDDFCELMGEVEASGNHDSLYPYSDKFGWLMVFNNKLEFLFEPVKMGPYTSQIQIIPYRPTSVTYLAVLFKYPGTLDLASALLLLNINGDIIKKRVFPDFGEVDLSFLINSNSKKRNDLFLIHKNGIIEQLDSNLKTVKINAIEGINNVGIYPIDPDNDKNEEFLFFSHNYNKIIITRNDFSNPVDIKTTTVYSGCFSVNLKGNEIPDLTIQQFDGQKYLMRYYRNPLYSLKYPIYAGIYAGILLLIIGLMRIQKYRLKLRYDTEKKIAELQLRSIKNQIDPHFTLNILNSIGSLFYKKDEEKANWIFGKYAKLLRSTILKSDNILIPLHEELDYIKNYLDLEKFRLDDKFEYEVVMDDSVNKETLLPKMLLHTFVENAVKHGLRHLKSKGFLKISINKSGLMYIIDIIDNGIGRNSAKQYAVQDTNKGLEIIDNILELYYNLYKKKIQYEIIDIGEKDGGGTHIKITIPVSN
jgi:hypothetical protein